MDGNNTAKPGWGELMRLLLYCICGGVGVLSDYLTYYVLIELGVWYQGANVSGYAVGTIVSFFLNRKITFNVPDKIIQRLFKFLGVGSVGFIVSAALLWGMVEVFFIDEKLAKLLTLPVVVLIQFSLNRRITFNTVSSPIK